MGGRWGGERRYANDVVGLCLKCDIKQYFESVDREVLLGILSAKVKDENILWLVKVILNNYSTAVSGKGMPLGNWTSQFFANVYLNELDQFVKHVLKVKFYIRYVDDFVILHRSRRQLQDWKEKIEVFLREKLLLELHPNKCKIIPLRQGVCFLGFRIFYNYKRVRLRNGRKVWRRLAKLIRKYREGAITAADVRESFQGWNGYACQGNTYGLRMRLQSELEKELMKDME